MTRPWVLAIDFGTSYSMGATCEVGSGRVELVEVNGARAVPSGVWVDGSGVLVVGQSAARQARLAPGRWERSPKRFLGEPAPLVLGDVEVQIVDAVAAVLRVIAEEAVAVMASAPVAVRLTHPARWGQRRRGALLVAAGVAGLGGSDVVTLVPEPAAAAWYFASRGELAPGARVAVFDLGGGTFDAAVLRAADEAGAGPRFVIESSGGVDGLGGERFDALLLDHVGQVVAARAPGVWEQVLTSTEPRWRSAAEDALREVRRGKEELSRYASVTLDLGPLVDVPVQLTRDEVEELLAPQVARAADELAATLERAGVGPRDLAGIYLAGGSSRMPLVSRLVADRFGITPSTLGEPKSVVAAGAALWEEGSTTVAPPPPPPDPVIAGDAGTRKVVLDDKTTKATGKDLPPPPPSPKLGPGAPWWKRPALAAPVGALAVVGLVAAAVALGSGGGGGGGAGTGSTPSSGGTPDAGGTTGPPVVRTGLSATEARFAAQLDRSYIDTSSCAGRPDLEDERTLAALTCDPASVSAAGRPPGSVEAYLEASVAALRTDFQPVSGSDASAPASCDVYPAGLRRVSVVSWSCALDGNGGARIAWTQESEPLSVYVLRGADGDLDALSTWWNDVLG